MRSRDLALSVGVCHLGYGPELVGKLKVLSHCLCDLFVCVGTGQKSLVIVPDVDSKH